MFFLTKDFFPSEMNQRFSIPVFFVLYPCIISQSDKMNRFNDSQNNVQDLDQ